MPFRLLTNRFKSDSFQHFPMGIGKKYQSAYKPGFVPMGSYPQCMAIHLEFAFPQTSRNQPGRRTENSPALLRVRATPIRSCSGWGLPCQTCCQVRGALLPHRFTLTASKLTAVYFLWHFPWGHPRRALPGTLFPWSPDFPPLHPFEPSKSGHPADW